MSKSRIPAFCNANHEGVAAWFDEMYRLKLLFHPDDSSDGIYTLATGEKAFTAAGCRQLEGIVKNRFERFGSGVYDAAYPVFMRCLEIAV